jgi:hypothetical protein
MFWNIQAELDSPSHADSRYSMNIRPKKLLVVSFHSPANVVIGNDIKNNVDERFIEIYALVYDRFLDSSSVFHRAAMF